jgi:enoyl-[acyl-carrier protein] reductase I
MDLNGKKGLIVGIANEHSIAYGCAKICHQQGADLALTYHGEKSYGYVHPLAHKLNAAMFTALDAADENSVSHVCDEIVKTWGKLDFLIHSLAFAPQIDLHNKVVNCSQAGFLKTMDISCYSLIMLARYAQKLMVDGGSIITMSYIGAQRVIENYNVMGVAKAALEASVRYLAHDLGEKKIRVNAISPGPIKTRAASGIKDFDKLYKEALENAPIKDPIAIDDVGNLAAFLASDRAKNITGQCLIIDSGNSG